MTFPWPFSLSNKSHDYSRPGKQNHFLRFFQAAETLFKPGGGGAQIWFGRGGGVPLKPQNPYPFSGDFFLEI